MATASALGRKVDVFETSTASGGAILSTLRNRERLRSRFSETASITRSVSSTVSLKSKLIEIRDIEVSISSEEISPAWFKAFNPTRAELTALCSSCSDTS